MLEHICNCGCGHRTTMPNSKFLRGHNLRLKNPMSNPESVRKTYSNRGVKKYDDRI